MPPRAGRPRNTNQNAESSTSMAHPQVLEGPSGGGYPYMPPTGEPSYTQNYAPIEPQVEMHAAGERPFIPDIPVSIIEDPRSKAVLRSSLNKLANEMAPGAKLEDDAAELLLYMASDFLTSMANFSCRLASHRGSENLDTRDVELYLERMHGMRVSLMADSPLPLPPPPPPLADPTPHVSAAPTPVRKRETTPPLAQTRPRRHTNATAQEEDDEEEDSDEEEEDEEGGEEGEGGDSEEEKPRESRRLRERAVAAEKQKRKRGRPRK